MHIKTLAMTALAAAVAVGCAQQPVEEKAEAPAKAAPAKPALMSGASAAMLANTCAGCHGTNGVSTGPAAPTIAGMESDYLTETMQAYKSGDRASTIMGRIAKGYSDAEIEQIAEFYSEQEYVGYLQAAVGPKARMGHKIHENFCEKCHEDNGMSVEDTPLAGQWMPYIEWTVADYLDGHNKPTKDMKKAMDKLMAAHPDMSTAQMAHDLSHFYGSRNGEGYVRVPGRLK